jgi:hypothetical protein
MPLFSKFKKLIKELPTKAIQKSRKAVDFKLKKYSVIYPKPLMFCPIIKKGSSMTKFFTKAML